MANNIHIDTKYAKRDVDRMKNAATALEDAAKKYNELRAHVESVYKGDAAVALAHAAATESKKCTTTAEQLRSAAKKLQHTINQYEKQSEKMVTQIKGS